MSDPMATTPLSRERIMDAALAVVRQDGLDALSMRKVAARLDVEAMSLYRHVRDKADLLDTLHDDLVGRVALPGSGDWPDEVRRVALAFRDVLFAEPGCVPLLASRPTPPPRAQRLIKAGISLLEDRGFSPDEAVVAFQTVFCFVIGHAVFHTSGGQIPADTDWTRREFDRGVTILLDGLGRHPSKSQGQPPPVPLRRG